MLDSTPDEGLDPSPVAPAGNPVDGETPAPAGMTTAEPPVELLPGFVASGTCSGSLGACENGSTVPCTLHCATRANGCEVSSEFVPLGAVDPRYHFQFRYIDPAGEWAVYSRNWSGSAYEYTPYRWSAAEGVVLLSEALGVPPAIEEESLVVVQVAARGAAILLQRIEPLEGYVWTRDAGLTALDFEPRDMSADGRVVAGLQGNDVVIWDREKGTRIIVGDDPEKGLPLLDGGTLDATAPDAGVRPVAGTLEGATAPDAGVEPFWASGVSLSDTGELALVYGVGASGFHWSEARGAVPYEALPGFPAGGRVAAVDPSGRVLWVSTGSSTFGPWRLWRWTEEDGALALGTLPRLPADTSYNGLMQPAGGRVLVGEARTATGQLLFRWSSELGMQQISSSTARASYSDYHANADGTTIVASGYVSSGGAFSGGGTFSSSFRWTAHAGRSDFTGRVSGVALGGDLVLATVWDGTNYQTRVLEYDSALDNGGALPIDIIAAGLTPPGYEQPSIEALSENARLLAGTARDGENRSHAWLLRLHDTCSP